MSTALREIIASFGVDFDKEGNLAKGDKKVDGLTEKLVGLGKTIVAAFAVDAIVSFGHELLQEADALAKQSQALGVSAEELQGWQHAAALSGSSAEEFSAAFTKFTRNVNEAGEAAGGPAAKALKALGVDFKDAAGNIGAPIDLLDGVVAGLEGIEDPAKRTALVMDLFGKSGAKLLPLFAEGTDGLAKLRAEVAELGFGFDEAFLENAQEVNDNVDRLKLGVKGLAIQVIGPILPGLVRFTQRAVAVAKSIVGWIKQVDLARVAMVAIGGKTIPMLIAGVGRLGTILTGLGSIVLRTIAPFLLLEDALTFLSGGDSLIGRGLEKAFGDGTAATVRKWCQDAGEAIKSVFIGALDLLKIAFADTDEEAQKLWEHFAVSTRPVERILDSLLEKIGFMIKGLTSMDTLVTGLADLGDLIASPFKSDEEKERDRQLALFRQGKLDNNLNPVAEKKPNIPALVNDLYGNSKQTPLYAGLPYDYTTPTPQPAAARKQDWSTAFTSASAPAPMPAAQSYVDQSQTTVAPVANVTVNVQGGDAEVGNRIGKATAKAVNDTSLRAAKAALVPTPG